MKLYLYSTEDDEIVLNKSLKNEKVIDINFKANCNQLDTQVILNYKQGNFVEGPWAQAKWCRYLHVVALARMF